MWPQVLITHLTLHGFPQSTLTEHVLEKGHKTQTEKEDQDYLTSWLSSHKARAQGSPAPCSPWPAHHCPVGAEIA